MKWCSLQPDDGIKSAALIAAVQLVDLLMFLKILLSADDLELMLRCCDENHAANLKIDPIALKYQPIERLSFICACGADILSSSNQNSE